MDDNELAPACSYDVMATCNFNCRFCFGRFKDVRSTVLEDGKDCLEKEDSLKLIEALAEAGMKKIKFSGGEPTLCPWLSELIERAHSRDMIVALGTNGHLLAQEAKKQTRNGLLKRLSPYLHWIALSVDSGNAETNLQMGRRDDNDEALSAEDYARVADAARALGVRVRVNTVVNAYNLGEDMSEWVRMVKPERWKLIQVLPMGGQNDETIGGLEIDETTFLEFAERHTGLEGVPDPIPAVHGLVYGAFIQIDPAGRFFDNVDGRHVYSQPILSAGVENAWKRVRFYPDKFEARGAFYDW